MTLTDGRTIPATYRTFTHGYAVTSHAAQGKTVDEVLIVASALSLPAVHQEQFYVSISRGRDRCRIFTDDADLLRSHVNRSSTRLAAVEAVSRERLQASIWQRSYRFLKTLRQRVTQFRSLSPRKGIIHPPRNAHEHRNTHRISH